MKARVDARFLRTLMAIRISLADKGIYRGLAQTKDRLLRERSRDQLVNLISQGWDSYDLAGEADPDSARHDMPPSIPDRGPQEAGPEPLEAPL